MKDFWETMATSIIPRLKGGHLDLFIPLTETGKNYDIVLHRMYNWNNASGKRKSNIIVHKNSFYFPYFSLQKLAWTCWYNLVCLLTYRYHVLLAQLVRFFKVFPFFCSNIFLLSVPFKQNGAGYSDFFTLFTKSLIHLCTDTCVHMPRSFVVSYFQCNKFVLWYSFIFSHERVALQSW